MGTDKRTYTGELATNEGKYRRAADSTNTGHIAETQTRRRHIPGTRNRTNSTANVVQVEANLQERFVIIYILENKMLLRLLLHLTSLRCVRDINVSNF